MGVGVGVSTQACVCGGCLNAWVCAWVCTQQVIEARRKLEQAEKDRAREEAVREAQQRIETELVFDFSFN